MKLNKLFATLLMFVLLITSIPDTNIMAASKVPAPTIQTIKQSSGACVTVKWKKVKNAKGYLVYRRTGSKGKYKQIKKISKNTTLSYVDKTTKDGTTYYYKIRAYIGATKSPNSGAKKIKTSGTPKLGELVSDSTGIFENTDAKVTCSIKVKNFIRVKKNTIALYSGNTLVGYMHDDGKNGDIQKNDGIFSYETVINNKADEVSVFTCKYKTNKSNAVTVKTFRELTEESITSFMESTKSLESIADSYLENGYIPAEKADDAIEKVYEEAEKQYENGSIIELRKNEYGVTMRYANGMYYVYSPQLEGIENAGNDVSLRIMTMQPYQNSGNKPLTTDSFDNNASKISNTLNNCSFVEQDNYDDENVKLKIMKNLASNEFIIWNGHGGYDDELGPYTYTGESCENYNKFSRDSFVDGSIMHCGDRMVITSGFVKKYVPKVHNSFLYLGTCLGAKDTRLVDAYVEKGFSVMAFNDSVIALYDRAILDSITNSLLTVNQETQYYYSMSEAFEIAKNTVGKNDKSFYYEGIPYQPENANGAEPCLFGDYILSNKCFATLKLNKKSINIKVGKTDKIKAETNSNQISWLNTNDDCVKMSISKDKKTVMLNAKKAGNAKIICKVGDKTAVCNVKVKAPANSVSLKDGWCLL